MSGLSGAPPSSPSRHPRLLLAARDAEDTPENRAFVALVRSMAELADRAVAVLVLHGGPLIDELVALAPTTVADDLPRRTPSALVERVVGRIGFRRAAARRRGHRLGLAGFASEDRVYLHDVLLVQVLRYLPATVPVVCRVPESAHPLHLPLSETDLRLLLAAVDRFLVATEDGAAELIDRRGVPEGRVALMREVVVGATGPTPPVAAARRAELGVPADAVLVGVFEPSTLALPTPAVPLAVAIRRLAAGAGVVLVVVVPEHTVDWWAPLDIAGAGLGDRVRLVELAGSDPPDAGLLDIVVTVTWGSQQPRAYLDAAAAGVPVVCAEGDELVAVVGEDEGGFVVPRLDLPAMAAAVAALASDPVLRRRMGDRAAARVLAAYSATEAARSLETELVGAGR